MEWLLIFLVSFLWLMLLQERRRVRAAERRAQADDGFIRGVLMATVDDYAYWLAGGRLVRAPWADGQADLSALEFADPVHCPDLTPEMAREIAMALSTGEVQARYGPPE